MRDEVEAKNLNVPNHLFSDQFKKPRPKTASKFSDRESVRSKASELTTPKADIRQLFNIYPGAYFVSPKFDRFNEAGKVEDVASDKTKSVFLKKSNLQAI